MYSEIQLIDNLDNRSIEYIRNKHKGGEVNQKGNSYEVFFATYKMALLARKIIEQEVEDIKIFSQIIAFVDDLIIDSGIGSDLQHFQLKESKNLSWGSDSSKVKLAFDFRQQFELNMKALNRSSKMSVVVSSEDVANKLAEDMPVHIQSYSSVVVFPYRKTIDELLRIDTNLKEAIAYLTAFDNPTQDKIECVAKILIGAWISSDTSQTTVRSILQTAQKCQPSFIRSLKSDDLFTLEPEFILILQSINGFTYSISKGFFHWQYSIGGMDGSYPYSLESEEFKKLQKRILQIKPTTFDDLENFL